MRIAAIDIGSNAARLLINEVVTDASGQARFTKLNLLRIPLRLGMDVFQKGEIGTEREKMVLQSMKVFRSLMDIYNIQHYRACATSAMRDARNGSNIIKKVHKTANIKIEIISGDEEASLIYENHIADSMDDQYGYLYIDVGGGSTELMYYENKKLLYKRSFNIGTIRILQDLVNDFHWDELKKEIQQKILGDKPIIAIGSGGNINKIFSLSKTKDKKPMTAHYLKTVYKEILPLSVPERMVKYNIREDRADVMIPALQIFNKVMQWGKINQIYVPKISVADGLIQSIYKKLNQHS
ncbi:exopolyphosphatase [Elizabethkingia sp. JS20170427COW]|uniref:Ppx/GppA phosphatase family protein n=1 Tax=Elizabethkingia sp. JS20170427COW TaxID=2583851 RepID=UPI0011108896|nr:exopolyphosphatase [Elizabethkingia sp. JS20170427COW]QCX52718.1 exopolyphosphatase [Elizabethkingia sp. JS20170427COW]